MKTMIPWLRWPFVLPMRTLFAGRWLPVVFLSCFLCALAGTTRAAGVDLRALTSIAMEQYMGWKMAAPGQAVLDAYPNGEYLWLRGLAQDLRWFAKNNSRLITFYDDPKYQVKALALLRQAEALAASDEAALRRLHGHALGWLERFIPAIRPVADKPMSAKQYQEFRNALCWYQGQRDCSGTPSRTPRR